MEYAMLLLVSEEFEADAFIHSMGEKNGDDSVNQPTASATPKQ